MKGEVLVHRRLASADRVVDPVQAAAKFVDGAAIALIGRDAGRLHLDGDAQLHHVHHLGQRSQVVLGDAKWPVCRSIGNERAGALPRDHQPLRPQRGNGLAHHRATDLKPRHQLLFRRQPFAWTQCVGPNLAAQDVDELARAILQDRQPHRSLGITRHRGQPPPRPASGHSNPCPSLAQ
jgi:hypothetical protein